jgi:DNA mismatch endonuclease (patch repair protein)
MDVVSPATRSRMMAGIRGKDTKPEILVRKMLHAAGYRFRLHRRDLPGSPDIVLPKYRLAIFVHGCFWHQHEGCKFATVPATRAEFWEKKLASNRGRDQRDIGKLLSDGWRVMVIWECMLRDKDGKDGLVADLSEILRKNPGFIEIPSPKTIIPGPSYSHQDENEALDRE